MSDDPIREAARNAHKAGLAVVPPKEDGTKRPDVGEWTTYQRRRTTSEELRAWFSPGRGGVGLVMGAVSGGLETIEFDDRATYERYIEIAQGTGLGNVVSRIRAGYEEQTPGGGVHWLYRCTEIAGNTTLARRPTDDPKKLQTLIQTRGEGGYLVVAPSNGTVHPSGGAYRLVSGGFASIVTISPEERWGLWDLARTFDECPRPAREEPSAPASAVGNRPGDHFNQRATWDEILAPHGWVLVHERGGVGYWRRPGKARGLSATTNHAGSGLFYPFTSSTVFDSERGYSKFACYAILEHGGDFRAAADALGKAGYGAALPKGKFGAGRSETPEGEELRLEALVMVASEPPLYDVTINGELVRNVGVDDLLAFRRFRACCFVQLDRSIALPRVKGRSQQDQWDELIGAVAESMRREEVPEEMTESGQLRSLVDRYLLDTSRHITRWSEFRQGFIVNEDSALHFRGEDLLAELVNWGADRKMLESRVWATVLRPAGATSIRKRPEGRQRGQGRQLRLIRYPLSKELGEPAEGQRPLPDGDAT